MHACTVFTSAPSAPRNVTLREITSTYAVIQWIIPEFPNGIIQNYTLSLTDANDGTEMNITTDPDQLSVNVTGLDPFTHYWIVVYAETIAVGEGSSNFSIRTLQDSKRTSNNNNIVLCMLHCTYCISAVVPLYKRRTLQI